MGGPMQVMPVPLGLLCDLRTTHHCTLWGPSFPSVNQDKNICSLKISACKETKYHNSIRMQSRDIPGRLCEAGQERKEEGSSHLAWPTLLPCVWHMSCYCAQRFLYLNVSTKQLDLVKLWTLIYQVQEGPAVVHL